MEKKKSDIQILIDHYGGKPEVAKLLGITVRHVENCLKGKHMGTSLGKLIKNYVVMFVG
jgi:hypothetical protein